MADSDAAYTTVSAVKAELGVTSTSDDGLLSALITQASRRIDALCARRFYTPTADETRVFDLPADVRGDLWLDEDLYSLTSVVNGDGTTIAADTYVLLPANKTPKYALRLRAARGVVWRYNATGDSEQVIQVVGKWGYSASAPDAVQRVCRAIVKHWYTRRADSAIQSTSIGDYSVTYASAAPDAGDLPPGALDDLRLGGFIKTTV